MKEYKVVQLTEALIYPAEIQVKSIIQELNNLLEQGFEIYKSIQFSGDNFAGIKYILRKKIEEGETQ